MTILDNNIELQEILDTVNELPEDGSNIDTSLYLEKSGGNMEGTLTASYSEDGGQVRNVFILTAEPDSSIGKDGDIALVIGG